jgi:hypothetical protein
MKFFDLGDIDTAVRFDYIKSSARHESSSHVLEDTLIEMRSQEYEYVR